MGWTKTYNIPTMPTKEPESIKPVDTRVRRKYTNAEIIDLFNLFRNDSEIRSNLARRERWGDESIYPVHITDYKNPTWAKERLTTTKFNALIYINAGSVYDNWLKTGDDVIEDEDRINKVVNEKLPAILDRMQYLLDTAENPLYRHLYVEAVNKHYVLTISCRDRGDDGNDKYGIQVWLRITFKPGTKNN